MLGGLGAGPEDHLLARRRRVVTVRAGHGLVLLSRTPSPSVRIPPVPAGRQARAAPPLLLQPVHHVLDRLQLARGAGRPPGREARRRGRRRAGRGPGRRRPRAEGPAAGRHRLERRAVGRGREGVRGETVALELVEGAGQGVRVVGEEGRVLGRGEGELRVEQHARRHPGVHPQGAGGYEGARARVQARHGGVEVGEKGRVERRADRDVRPGPLRARRPRPASPALRPRRLAPLAPLARPVLPVAAVLALPLMVRRVRRVRAHHVQQLVLVVQQVVDGVGRAPLLGGCRPTCRQTGTAA